MSDIAPIGRPLATSPSSSHRLAPSVATEAAPNRGVDSVDLSRAAQFLSKLSELPDVRQDVVDRVKGEIAKGGYDNDTRIDGAINGLIEDLA
jgi:hypothetical protein